MLLYCEILILLHNYKIEVLLRDIGALLYDRIHINYITTLLYYSIVILLESHIVFVS